MKEQDLYMEQTFQLKGKLFTLSVLQVESNSISLLEKQLKAKIKLAPKFFNDTPIVIDLHKIEGKADQIDISALHKVLQDHHLIPVGFRCSSDTLRSKIAKLGMPIIKEARATAQSKEPTKNISSVEKKEVKNESQKAHKNTIIIEQPVRSGQQVHAPDGDLIILSSVSPGAELLAEGSIHVYGVLRGRALAGLNGDTEARVFCKKLEADLVSIAGQYRLFEEPLTENHRSVAGKQVYLKNGQLIIDEL
jgi:septum site-determining protein MinC